MDFGEILEQWENRQEGDGAGSAGRSEGEDSDSTGGGGPKGADMQALLDRYPPTGDREAPAPQRDTAAKRRLGSRYRRMKNREPQAELDLHGLRAAEAQVALEGFLRDAAARGLGKVLIIHGKGNHTRGRPVLEGTVRAWLERSPLAGAFGRADRRHGGGGATWVILREGEPR